ncbi:hypothetical protein V1478_007464 [Vespula squamosa]|uniref:Uncharacterized protein n=1 Tax=Vespula squamosa TaxID=30214 RepID=A0ABD2B3C2_VESSQ
MWILTRNTTGRNSFPSDSHRRFVSSIDERFENLRKAFNNVFRLRLERVQFTFGARENARKVKVTAEHGDHGRQWWAAGRCLEREHRTWLTGSEEELFENRRGWYRC